MNSGNCGYCELLGHNIGIIYTWDDNDTIIDVDCKYKTCQYVDTCLLYQERPVGFHQTYPLKK